MKITATIIAMAHNLGFKVSAEGVETPEQLAFLQAKGCDSYQGYLHSRALPAEALLNCCVSPESQLYGMPLLITIEPLVTEFA